MASLLNVVNKGQETRQKLHSTRIKKEKQDNSEKGNKNKHLFLFLLSTIASYFFQFQGPPHHQPASMRVHLPSVLEGEPVLHFHSQHAINDCCWKESRPAACIFRKKWK